MARQTKSKVKPFSLEDSPVVEENERILEQGKTPSQMEAEEQQKQENVAQQATEVAPAPSTVKVGTLTGMKPLKAEKGVKIALPMEYYFKLVQMKACTGKSLQDLAAQGVMEFIDRFKGE